MNEMATITCQRLGTYFFVLGAEKENRPQIALASKHFAPLICRVVRAMRAVRWRWALGLDSRLATPNLRQQTIHLCYPADESNAWYSGNLFEMVKIQQISD